MVGQDFFKKVFPENERDKVLKDFVRSDQNLHTKIAENDFLILKPFLINNSIIACGIPSRNLRHISKKIPSSSFHNFMLSGERYYFQSSLEQKADRYEIVLPQDLYQLQRRQSYRVKIPVDYLGTVEAHLIKQELPTENSNLLVRGVLVDLSLGGCSFELPLSKLLTRPLTMGEEINFDIYFSKILFLKAHGKVRRSQVKEIQNAAKVSIGIEFCDLSSAQEQKIFNLTLDLHRKSYGRLA
jgi:c-di-GMP-binding flagellar brake protein YcgR